MAEAVILLQQSNGFSHQPLTPSAELAQYDRILSLRDEIIAGKHPRIKLPVPLLEEDTAATLPPVTLPVLPNGGSHALPALNDIAITNSKVFANQSSNLTAKPISPVPHASGLNPIFLQESEVVVKAKMKLERQRIERSLQEQIKQRSHASRQRESNQDILPDFDVSEVFYQAQELVKPIDVGDANLANRQVSSSDTVDDNTYYSSQANESAEDGEVEGHPKRRATKPCRFYFEGSCKKGNNCTFSHDPAFKQKLQVAHAETSEREPVPNARTTAQGFTARGGKIRDSPTYDSRESGELVEDAPYSPAFQAPVDDYNRRPPHEQGPRTQGERNMQRTRSQAEGRQPRRVSPQSKEGRIVRNHITSPAAPQPSRVSPLAVAKVSRVERIRPDIGENSPRQARQQTSDQHTPVVGAPSRARKRRRELDVNDASRNVAPRRHIESPVPYIKEEPVSPPSIQAMPLPPSRTFQHEEVRRPLGMGPPSPRHRERVVYQPMRDDHHNLDGSGLRRVSSPSVRRVVSGPISHQALYREPDLRRVVSTRYIERPVSPMEGFVSVSEQPRSARAMSHYAAPLEEPPQAVYRASVQPQRPAYLADDRRASPIVQYVRQPPPEPESISMGPPHGQLLEDTRGNRRYEAPVSDRRASVMPEARYAPQVPRYLDQVPTARGSVRPENVRVYHDDGYTRGYNSPQPPSPQYVQYRASLQPAPGRVMYEAEGRSRNEVIRVVENPQDRRVERYEDFQRPRESIARMPSVRPQEVHYVVPNDRYQRVTTVQPEQHRFVDVSRNGASYVREVREVSVRPEDPYGAQMYGEPGRPRYRYVTTSHGSGSGPRAIEGDDVRMG
ncbi:MAG: hypothetical protein LQ340_001500 [Diploschistes diacapsis]|nr:MAG: hypothetical protein LQ340_001500 [Diploschistes diacapsis]